MKKIFKLINFFLQNLGIVCNQDYFTKYFDIYTSVSTSSFDIYTMVSKRFISYFSKKEYVKNNAKKFTTIIKKKNESKKTINTYYRKIINLKLNTIMKMWSETTLKEVKEQLNKVSKSFYNILRVYSTVFYRSISLALEFWTMNLLVNVPIKNIEHVGNIHSPFFIYII